MIFRKEEEKAERQKPFEEVRDSVESSAEQEKRDKLLESWLSNLRDKAQVKVHEDLIQVPFELEIEPDDPETPTETGTEESNEEQEGSSGETE